MSAALNRTSDTTRGFSLVCQQQRPVSNPTVGECRLTHEGNKEKKEDRQDRFMMGRVLVAAFEKQLTAVEDDSLSPELVAVRDVIDRKPGRHTNPCFVAGLPFPPTQVKFSGLPVCRRNRCDSVMDLAPRAFGRILQVCSSGQNRGLSAPSQLGSQLGHSRSESRRCPPSKKSDLLNTTR